MSDNIVQTEFAMYAPTDLTEAQTLVAKKAFAHGIAFALGHSRGKGRKARMRQLWADLRIFRDPWTLTRKKVTARAIALLRKGNLDRQYESSDTAGAKIRLPTGYTVND